MADTVSPSISAVSANRNGPQAQNFSDSTREVKRTLQILNEIKKDNFSREWAWGVGFFVWLLFIHATGIYFFTKGFLLTRLVLHEKSACEDIPSDLNQPFNGVGTAQTGCWHPKSFDKAVIIIIDALRYDFTVPHQNETQQAFHNKLPILFDTSVSQPHNAFLLPFIADPPTTTLQRLKGLTTGTLPTFIDLGSSFAGTEIEEDNLLIQMKDAGKKIVHLGDDTWTSLFPGYFEANISRAYQSFNVWDLHTVDDGVTNNLMPLLQENNKRSWDVIIAHYLGVDHAGHRFGPNHPAMASKLQQMNEILKEVISSLDQTTLLVVMGDHGMDSKGDHGGESDDEVQAALWMYSKKGIFGRTDPKFSTPPLLAKQRFVNQIDFVPTFSLLLGLPIPFNSLGKPIEEAFAGKKGTAWENLASVVKVSAGGIKRYLASYQIARGNDQTIITKNLDFLWASAQKTVISKGKEIHKEVYKSFSEFVDESLRTCRGLWARFDIPSMILGISILAAGLIALVYYMNATSQCDFSDNPELEKLELQLEFENLNKGHQTKDKNKTTSEIVVKGALLGSLLGTALSPTVWVFTRYSSAIDLCLAITSISGLLGVLYQQLRHRLAYGDPYPTSYWSWLAVLFTILQSIGFASNSYTIWEDSILLFFITSFGISAATTSLRIKNASDRSLGIYYSLVFVLLSWLASFSKLCREEQLPFCQSTFYSSNTSSTSAPWQLLLPFLVGIFLPSIVKSFYARSCSYEGLAPIWIGWVFRIGLVSNSIFWTLDAADNGAWLSSLSPEFLKQVRVTLAQTIFAIAIVAGSTAFKYAPPCIHVSTSPASLTDDNSENPGTKITILGFANTHGTRYFLLMVNIVLCLLLVQKPMGSGALALMTWQILTLAEILDLNSLTSSPIGPIMLALLGSFYFFKTGHQATLSSIQWDSAFIPLHTVRYPFSPLLVILNTFGTQIFAATAVPLLVLWKQKPRKKNILKGVIRSLSIHLMYYTMISLATCLWAAWLRRHLMLYRIFSPKFMMSAAVLLVVDLVSILVAMLGFRTNSFSVSEIFGWG